MSESESNVYVAHQNNIRNAWKCLVTDEIKNQFADMPQQERFEHYKRIDDAVNQLTRSNIDTARQNKRGILSASEKDHELAKAAETIAEKLISGTFE